MAELYFKTPKTSETGKKFQVLIDRSIVAHEDIKNFVNDVGASDRYSTGSYYTLNTGANGFMFDNPVNTTVWKKVHTLPQGDLWYPRSTKAGKPLLERLDKIDKIHTSEVDKVIGYSSIFNHIGWNQGAKGDHFGFIIDSDWGHTMPEDCTEITGTEYTEL